MIARVALPLLAAAGITLTSLALPAARPAGIDFQLVDDVGKPIEAPLSVWQVGAEGRRRIEERPLGVVLESQGFDALEIEGDRHGPARFTQEDLRAKRDVRQLLVPRKMHVLAESEVPFKLAFFRQRESSLKTPAIEFAVSGVSNRWIPADDYLMVVSQKGFAPELRLVARQPGASLPIGRPTRLGWSLVIAATMGPDATPVAGAKVRLLGPPPPADDPGAPPRIEAGRELVNAATNDKGFVVFNGLGTAYVSAQITAQRLAPREARGIAAASGTYAYSRVAMLASATLSGVVRVDGEPARGFTSRLLIPPETESVSKVVLRARGEAKVAADGRFRFADLAPNAYILRTLAPDGQLAEDRRVIVEAGIDATVDVDLLPIRIDGTVRRGRKPLAGIAIDIMRRSPERSHDFEGKIHALTDDDGRYAARVFHEDNYYISALVDGAAAESKARYVGKAGASVDFELNEDSIEGIVVDEKDRPLKAVAVLMEFPPKTHRTVGRTTDDGRFRAAVGGAGQARLWGIRSGGTRSEDAFVDVPPPPGTVVKLVLKSSHVHGRLLSVGGSPAAGATIAAIDAAASVLLDVVATGPDGQFDLFTGSRSSVTVFLGGAACPLGQRQVALDGAQDLELRCLQASGGIDLRLLDENNRGIPGQMIRLRSAGSPVPDRVLLSHLWQMGLSGRTDGEGRIPILSLEPGPWDLFLGAASSDFTLTAGLPEGHLTSVSLSPGQVAETVVHVKVSRLPEVTR